MSARMQFCGLFPCLRAVSGIWSGAAADSLSLGSKRSGCVGLQSTQPKHRRFETVRLSASRPNAGRSTQSPGTSAKLLHGRTRGAVSGGWKVKVKGVKARSRSRAEFVGLRGGRQGVPAELLAVCVGRQGASVELLAVCAGRQSAPAELLPVRGGGQSASVKQLSVRGGRQGAPAELLAMCVGRQGASVEQLSVRGGRQSAPAELLAVCVGRQSAPAELLPVCGGGQGASVEL